MPRLHAENAGFFTRLGAVTGRWGGVVCGRRGGFLNLAAVPEPWSVLDFRLAEGRVRKDLVGLKTLSISFARPWSGGLVALFCFGLSAVVGAQTPAFPGAEGFGRFAKGGRGGEVFIVTNLNDSGPGSLREGVTNRTQGVPRTIVFAISGTIFLDSTLRVRAGDLTIAGQSAPGDGICLANYPIDPSNSSNVIIRFIRSRLGDLSGVENDAFSCRYATDVIVDHCSFSWSVDETATAYDNTRFTMQWCFVTESLRDSVHEKGLHGYGGIWGGLGASFHHNLMAHHDSRNPRLNGARYHNTDGELVDMRNNVIYNWKGNSVYGGEPTETGIPSRQNLINNFYRSGPATGGGSIRSRILNPSRNTSAPFDSSYGLFHVDGNRTTASSSVTRDNWAGGVQGPSSTQLEAMRTDAPFDVAPVVTQSSSSAYSLVRNFGGCRLPVRDSVDERIAGEVASGTTTYSGSKGGFAGIIDSQTDVGGWPELASTPAPTDSDADGMPDDWELERGLNPYFPGDRNAPDAEGYTNLELYLNELAAPAFPVPVISSQPMSQLLPPGTDFSLSVGTSGFGTFSYQWYLGGIAIEGARDSSYAVTSPTVGDTGNYQVMVTNEYGETASEVATVLFTEQPPVITSEPLSLGVKEGEAASFTVTVEGSEPFEYQWFLGDRLLPSETGAVLDLGPATFEEAGPYHVVATNAYGSATSASATLGISFKGEDCFSSDLGVDTIHAATPVVSPTATNWYVMSSENASSTSVGGDPATPEIVDPRLDLTMATASSGLIEAAAGFASSPVSLEEPGQELTMRLVLSTTNVSSLGLGLFNSGGSSPHTGMIDSKLVDDSSDFATGGTREWEGYRFHLEASAVDPGMCIEKRLVQSGLTNASQSLITPGTSSSAPDIVPVGTVAIPGFTWEDDTTYTLTLRVRRNTPELMSLTATIHAGTDLSAPVLGGMTAYASITPPAIDPAMEEPPEEPEPLVELFDFLSVGYRNRDDSSVAHVRVSRVIVAKADEFFSISSPYDVFIFDQGFNPTTDGLPDVDFEYDTVSNSLEYILGGDPKMPDPSVLPSLSDESGWVFRFLRHMDASVSFDFVVEQSKGLQSWDPVADGVDGVTFTITPFDAIYEQVEVRLPASDDPSCYLRLSATPRS